tara:strand:+ start:17760 stop:18026 length:267 start_codon:yes stop_codon:yes gene_type:complete
VRLLALNEISCVTGAGEEQVQPQKESWFDNVQLSQSQWTGLASYASSYLLAPHLPKNPQGFQKVSVPLAQTGAFALGYVAANLYFGGF